ncbi:GNAT family N-acetyltransferase [Galbitalea soli]|uniref:GNAT family N-acetyltransferase n=1 Tax=Galbitalea soli TaxID=1268042 RepID=A0A7C9TTR2_9MICO|nr:GNAT family N-acetyltransferase [Galbitalea soli]NEM92103.1 GNAT family N-acetyltransferase [Galbitalea soli]NYJ31945.1 ribosomal protein S18 acetylase RimI-like enzyme [Galbitalea soli]
MSHRIRLATALDPAALHEVAAATFPLACPPDTLPASIAAFIAEHLSEESFAGYLADPTRRLLVAEPEPSASPEPESARVPAPDTAPRLAGYTMLVLAEPRDPDMRAALSIHPSAELSKVYVRPEHHGSGLAAALVAATVELARAEGAAGLWLGVNQENARANRFYEKQGFARVGSKKFLVGARYEDDFVRERAL